VGCSSDRGTTRCGGDDDENFSHSPLFYIIDYLSF